MLDPEAWEASKSDNPNKQKELSGLDWNGCPKWIGITVRNESEWVSEMRRNTHLLTGLAIKYNAK